MSFLEEDICVMCANAPAEELCQPCNHNLICTKCSNDLQGKRPAAVAGKCMYCNTKIEKILTDYGDKTFSPPLARPSPPARRERENPCPSCSTGSLCNASRVLGGVNTHQCVAFWEQCNNCDYKTSETVEWD